PRLPAAPRGAGRAAPEPDRAPGPARPRRALALALRRADPGRGTPLHRRRAGRARPERARRGELVPGGRDRPRRARLRLGRLAALGPGDAFRVTRSSCKETTTSI